MNSRKPLLFTFSIASAIYVIVTLNSAHAQTDTQSAVAALKKWLAADESTRGPIVDAPFASVPLSREEADQAARLLVDDHTAKIRKTRREDMQKERVKIGEVRLRFWYKVFGEKPKNGRSLFISLHGGGGAPKQVNDQQWENQKRLYQPKEGVYVCPRGPSDNWNLWHEAHLDALLDRMIENLIVFEEVDSNRVYVMGYSAGGDGVYQLAPRMADRWAAASMMAGHPNDASARSLRNVPFTLHVGANDSAFGRNEVGRKWGERLAELRGEDPQGYEHDVQIHAGKGHWMDRDDAVALEWMAKHTRNPSPERLVWRQDDVTHQRSYWLAVPEGSAKRGTTIVARRDGQTIAIETKDVPKFLVRLSDRMLNLDQPVVVTVNGQEAFRGKLERTIRTLAATLAERGDGQTMYSAETAIVVPAGI